MSFLVLFLSAAARTRTSLRQPLHRDINLLRPTRTCAVADERVLLHVVIALDLLAKRVLRTGDVGLLQHRSGNLVHLRLVHVHSLSWLSGQTVPAVGYALNCSSRSILCLQLALLFYPQWVRSFHSVRSFRRPCCSTSSAGASAHPLLLLTSCSRLTRDAPA